MCMLLDSFLESTLRLKVEYKSFTEKNTNRALLQYSNWYNNSWEYGGLPCRHFINCFMTAGVMNNLSGQWKLHIFESKSLLRLLKKSILQKLELRNRRKRQRISVKIR